MGAPRPRPAARLLVLDRLDRVFLLHGNEPDGAPARYWYTPGGALQDGESYEDAAQREMREELGLRLRPGPCVWRGRQVFLRFGVLVESIERFFIVRAEASDLTLWQERDIEADHVDGHGWWTPREIRASTEPFFPTRLGELLDALLSCGLPDAPLTIDP